MASLKLALKSFRKLVVLKLNQLRILISFKVKNKEFKIVVNDRFEPIIKKTSRIVLALSIVGSFLTLPFPYSAAVSLFIVAVEQLIERVVFSFVSASIIPFPDFDLWRKANFAAVVLGVHKFQLEPATVGMYFSDQEAGRKVFEFIRLWNHNLDEDLGKGNVMVSFVIDQTKNKYAFFAYPNLGGPTLKKIMRRIKGRKSSIGKEPIMLVGQMVMCKLFNYENSSLALFRRYYSNGKKYHFLPFSGESSKPMPIPGVRPIVKNSLKIIERAKLTNKDIEKFMCDYNIDWDDKTQVPNSIFWYK